MIEIITTPIFWICSMFYSFVSTCVDSVIISFIMIASHIVTYVSIFFLCSSIIFLLCLITLFVVVAIHNKPNKSTFDSYFSTFCGLMRNSTIDDNTFFGSFLSFFSGQMIKNSFNQTLYDCCIAHVAIVTPNNRLSNQGNQNNRNNQYIFFIGFMGTWYSPIDISNLLSIINGKLNKLNNHLVIGKIIQIPG